jgi:hypothetical protein
MASIYKIDEQYNKAELAVLELMRLRLHVVEFGEHSQ